MSQFNRFASLFKVQAGEGRLVLLMLAFSFFLGIPRHFVYTASYALFLARFDASYLPFVYVGFATLAPICGLLFARLAERVHYAKLLVGTLGLLLVSLALFWLLLGSSSALWPTMAFAIWYWPLSILSVVIFWGLAGQIFNVRQGKRLFGVIGAGDSTASILGGLMIPVLVGAIGTVNLVLVAIVSLAAAIGVLLALTNAYPAKLRLVLTTTPSQHTQVEADKGLFQRRYVAMILGLVVLSIVSYFFLDILFFGLAESQYPAQDQLASFLGIFSALVGVTTLFGQLVVSGFFLTRYGVRAGILALPVVVVAGLTLIGLTDIALGAVVAIFWLAAVTKILDRGLRDSVDRSALQTLYQPFSAADRAQIITTVDGIVEPLAAGIAGLGLLLLNSFFVLDPVRLVYPALILAIAWVLLAYAVGSDYPVMLVEALRKRRLGHADLSLADASSMAVVKHAVNDPNPAVALHALHLLESAHDESLELLLPTLLQHSAPEVRLAALQRIESRHLTTSFVRALLRDLIADEDNGAVRGAALRTLAALHPEDAAAIVAPYVHDSTAEVRRGALVALLLHGNDAARLTAQQEVVSLTSAVEPAPRMLAAQVIGDTGASEMDTLLLRLSEDENVEVQRAAVLAAGKARRPELWQHVLDSLENPRVAGAAATALIAGGESALPEIRLQLNAAAVDGEHERVKLMRLALVCGRIKSDQICELLRTKLHFPNADVRTQILHALSHCAYHASPDETHAVEQELRREANDSAWLLAIHADLERAEQQAKSGRVAMLRRALIAAQASCRQRIFYLLTFLFDRQAIVRARDNLAHPAADKRAYALEILDVLLDTQTKTMLFPLFEDLAPAMTLSRLSRQFPQPSKPATARLLELISASSERRDAWTKACAIYVAGELLNGKHDDELGAAITGSLFSPESMVREAAFWALYESGPAQLEQALSAQVRKSDQLATEQALRFQQLTQGGAAGMLSTIERVLFLRSVDLFEQVPDDVLAWVAQSAQEVHLGQGERFITQGDLGDSLFVIVDGDVDVMIEDKGKLATRGPKSVHGEMGILASQPRTATCIAATPTIALKISREDFLELLGEAPELALGVIHVLVDRLDEASQKVAGATARQQVAG